MSIIRQADVEVAGTPGPEYVRSAREPLLRPPEARERRARGAYSTPPALVELILDHALEPAIRDCLRTARTREERERALLSLRVLDPAAGSGRFLVAAGRCLGRALARVRSDPPSPSDTARAAADAAPCLCGVEVDPSAAAACREAVRRETGGRAGSGITTADALLEIDWSRSFPDVVARGGFDVVLGNPPFVNGIEGGIDPLTRARLGAAYPRVRGAADLSHFFLELGLRVLRPGGRLGFVMPRAALNAAPLQRLRAELPTRLRPNLLYAPARPDFFPGAAVFVCAVVLGPGARCRMSADPDPGAARWVEGAVDQPNWWLALSTTLAGASLGPAGRSRVGDCFEVAASMTASEAYELRPFLTDDERGEGLKLATTGLIEPARCLWGELPCRYLGEVRRFPRLRAALLPAGLRRRAARARRPKLLVAGLSRRVECFLDSSGEYLGAVSTYTICHPEDDLEALARLQARLLEPETTGRFRLELGGAALRGGSITMRKRFLQELSWP